MPEQIHDVLKYVKNDMYMSAMVNISLSSPTWKMKMDEIMKQHLADHVKLHENANIQRIKQDELRQTNYHVTSLMNLQIHLNVSKKIE